MTTTVFQNSTLSGDNTTPASTAWRLFFTPGVNGQGQIRITLQAGAGSIGGVSGIVCDHVSIGISTGVEPNITAFTEITFPGFAHGCDIEGAGATAVSDWVTFSFASTDSLGLSLDQGASRGFDSAQNGSATVGAFGNVWEKSAGPFYNVLSPAGMSNFGAFGLAIALVETRPVPGAAASGSGGISMTGVG